MGAFSEKFTGLPFKQRFETIESAESILNSIGSTEFAHILPTANNTREVLEECRRANVKFHNDKILPLLGLSEAEANHAVENANALVAREQYDDEQLKWLHVVTSMSACVNCDL